MLDCTFYCGGMPSHTCIPNQECFFMPCGLALHGYTICSHAMRLVIPCGYAMLLVIYDEVMPAVMPVVMQ